MPDAPHRSPRNPDQAEVFRFLAETKTHGALESVLQIDTHGAAVFLAGGDAYKVKRAVNFPFMNFSTLERRRQACEAELAVNRPHAPDLYLGILPITRSDSGGLALAGDGEVVEWAVHLRRFDERNTLDLVADRDGLRPELIADIAGAVGDWHQKAEIRDGGRATEYLNVVVEETSRELLDAPDVFLLARANRLAGGLREAFTSQEELLLKRGSAGQVRRCHGDLHLRNIAMIDGKPVLFDAIEFDEALATTDILYDLAFLLMDLWERGLKQAANSCLNRYLWGRPDLPIQLEGLAALPLFLSLRAAIRAKVEVLSLREGMAAARERADAYFTLAGELLAPCDPRMIAIGGLSGTGKTSLAAMVAPTVGRPPGAVHLRSDVERKRLLGVKQLDPLPPDAYDREASQACYRSLAAQAAVAIRAGQSVIVDAVHAEPDEREMMAEAAAACSAPFDGVWLEAPADTMKARVEARRQDASDATAEIVAKQATYDLGIISWRKFNAGSDLAVLGRQVLGWLLPDTGA